MIFTLLIALASGLYTENLSLTQLPNAKVIAEFKFSQTVDQLSKLPKAMAEILTTYSVNDLTLSFTRGRWQVSRYGYSDSHKPTGAHLITRLEVDQGFSGLTNALGGLLCSSLNFMDDKVTWAPHLAYPNKGGKLRVASVPREIVCTENLTPWSKLLPCGQNSGLAQLLNAYKLFDADYHSLMIEFNQNCTKENGENKCNFVFDQKLVTVLDPSRKGEKNWSFKTLFEREVTKPCPFADSSNVDLKFASKPREIFIKQGESVKTSSISLNNNFPYNIGVKYDDNYINKNDPQLVPIRMTRRLGGTGQEHGFLTTTFYNDLDQPSAITYSESIPWIVRLYLHTMKIEIQSKPKDLQLKPNNIYYSPAVDRIRPNILEVELILPPNSITILQIDVEFAFIKFSEHYPDANYGFEIG